MSEENVEILRRAFAAYEEGGVDALVPLLTEEVVVHSMPGWPDDAEYHGRAGLRKLSRQWTENFDEFHFEVESLHQVGDAVVALQTMTGRIKGTRSPVSQDIGSITEMRGGQISSIRYFSSWSDTLDAAGLSIQPPLP